MPLPIEAAARKEYPIGTGVLDYFPDAIAGVAKVSFEGNKQHNPGEKLHWAKEKSQDESDAMMRHYIQRYEVDEKDGTDHAAKMCWRALAFYQRLLEERAKASKFIPPTVDWFINEKTLTPHNYPDSTSRQLSYKDRDWIEEEVVDQ